MKLVKNFVLVVLFVSALAVNTFAGDMETPGYAPPPPSTGTSVTTATNEPSVTSGDSSSLGSGESVSETSDTLLYEALAALLSVF